MKWIVTLAALVLGVGLAPRTVASGGTQTFTQHSHAPMNLGPVPCPGSPAGDVWMQGNSVTHGTINVNGSWFTNTATGTVFQIPDSGFSGHATSWFGDENNTNAGVEVTHFTIDAHVVYPDGTRHRIHANGTMNTHADGTVTATHTDFRCDGVPAPSPGS